MKISLKEPARKFEVGHEKKFHLSDCGTISMEPYEQVTFVTEKGGEYDVTRQPWGFYATPSLNGRLASFNLRSVLVKNRERRFFVLLVERGKEKGFEEYVAQEQLRIITWLDSSEALEHLEASIGESPSP